MSPSSYTDFWSYLTLRELARQPKAIQITSHRTGSSPRRCVQPPKAKSTCVGQNWPGLKLGGETEEAGSALSTEIFTRKEMSEGYLGSYS